MPPRTASAPNSLAGLVVCKECESQMITTKVTTFRKNKEHLYLRPKNCPYKPKCQAFPEPKILEQTIETICQDFPLAVAALEMPNMDGIKNQTKQTISEKQNILEQLPNLIANNILEQQTGELRTYKLRTEISQLQNQLSQLPPVNLLETAKTVSIPQFGWDLSESERRFYFRELINKIEINRQDYGGNLQVIFIFDEQFSLQPPPSRETF